MTLDVEDRHWWYRGRRAIVLSVIRCLALPGNPRCLDAGCGGGANLELLANLGPVTGLEPDPSARSSARARDAGEVVAGSVEDMPFDAASFDLVTAFDVLEHIRDDVGALRELSRVASPGATLLMTVPAHPRLWSPHDVANEHQRRYTRRALVDAASSAGWRPILVSHFNTVLLPFAAVHRIVQRARLKENPPERSDFERTPGWVDRPLEKLLAGEGRAIERGARFPLGLSLVAAFESTVEPSESASS